jgi:phosphomannomutase
MLDLLKQVREIAVIGFVGGSDLAKQTEQLAIHGQNGAPVHSSALLA